jgi:hypothetical protein
MIACLGPSVEQSGIAVRRCASWSWQNWEKSGDKKKDVEKK